MEKWKKLVRLDDIFDADIGVIQYLTFQRSDFENFDFQPFLGTFQVQKMPFLPWGSKFGPKIKIMKIASRYYPYELNGQVSAHSDHPMLRSFKLFAKI